MKKAIVTGGTGFIGSHIVDRLIDMECEVIVIDRTDNPKNFNPKAKLLKLDITNIDPAAEIPIEFAGTDTIFHCAAMARVQPSIVNPIPYHDSNVNGTLNMLMAANVLSVNRFVYSASSSCYGDTEVVPTPETAPLDPMSPYALQKLIGEQYCRLFSKIYDLDTVCLRYFNVYGKRMAVDGESFNIGNGYSYSINEVADIIGGEKKYGEKRLEPFETLAKNNKAKEILGWEPKGDLEKYIKENY